MQLPNGGANSAQRNAGRRSEVNVARAAAGALYLQRSAFY